MPKEDIKTVELSLSLGPMGSEIKKPSTPKPAMASLKSNTSGSNKQGEIKNVKQSPNVTKK